MRIMKFLDFFFLGVRRSASNTNSSTPTQLQQLQMQLQLERQQVNAARQQLERYPRRQTQNQTLRETNTSNCGTSTMMLNASPVLVQPSSSSPSASNQQSQFLLTGKKSFNNLKSAELRPLFFFGETGPTLLFVL